MTHRNGPDPSPREVARAKQELRRAGLGDLADDTGELAEVRELLPPVSAAGYLRGLRIMSEQLGASTDTPRDDEDQDHAPEDDSPWPWAERPPTAAEVHRYTGWTSGGCPPADESQRLAEVLADNDPETITALGYDASVPGAREQAIAIMRKYIDAGRRCQACASLECPSAYSGNIAECPSWQEAEARRARGEYLPTRPGPHLEVLRATEPDRCPVCNCIGHGGNSPASGSRTCPGALELASDMPPGAPEPWLRAPESWPDAYRGRPVREVPRPYGGPLSDPWGRPWCDCGEPLELHAHIPGSITGAWCYAPRDARQPAEARDRLGRFLRGLALVVICTGLGIVVIYLIAAIMVLIAVMR